MNNVLDYPPLAFAVSFVVPWLSTRIGAGVRNDLEWKAAHGAHRARWAGVVQNPANATMERDRQSWEPREPGRVAASF